MRAAARGSARHRSPIARASNDGGAPSALALLFIASLAACRAAPAPSEPHALRARATSPAELLPDDLDFIVRVDAARVRQNPALAAVVRDLAKTTSSELVDRIQAALREASALWVGTRWMSDGFHGDGVVAIEARAGGDDLERVPSQAWRRLPVALPNVEAFERSMAARNDAVLRVEMRDHGVALATAAEADAVLRVLRGGPDEGRLDPPARGLLSFAGRLRNGAPLAAAPTSGMLRELMEGLIGYEGSLEEGSVEGADAAVGAAAIDVEASLAYASPRDAARAAEKAKQATGRLVAAGGIVGTMAHSVKLTELGASLRVRAAVPFAWLAELH